MTQRQRHASGVLSDPARRPQAVQPVAGRPVAAPTIQDSARSLPWDELYRLLPPDRQAEVLAVVQRQGFLFGHQLPAAPAGPAVVNAPAQPPHPDPARFVLGKMLAGDVTAVEPFAFDLLPPLNTLLDFDQRVAVAGAVQSPDLFLIQGLPGTGKSEVVAEIIRQAARRGERVLFLTPAAPAVDKVLGLLHRKNFEGVPDPANAGVFAVRVLGRDETPERLSPEIRRLTEAEVCTRLAARPLGVARDRLAGLGAEHARLTGRLTALDELDPVPDRLAELATAHEKVRTAAARVPAAVRADADAAETARDGEHPQTDTSPAAGPFAEELVRLKTAHREEHARLDREEAALHRLAEQRQEEEANVNRRCDPLRPLADAKVHGKWWTGAWWQATLQSSVLGELARLETEREQLQHVLADAKEQTSRIARARQELDARYAADRERHLQNECLRRQAELDQEAAQLRDTEAGLRETSARCWREADPAGEPPADWTAATVRECRERLREVIRAVEAETEFARHWLDALEAEVPAAVQRLADQAGLVAGTTTALPADARFGAAAAARQHFDLLILDEADRVTESEFLALSKRARRWVLVGGHLPDVGGGGETRREEAGGDGAREPGRPEDRRARGGPRKPRPAPPAAPLKTSGALRPGLFQRLWHTLHCDRWTFEGERLCCRLCPLTPEQQSGLEREDVADSPDTELRILNMPGERPRLAEVVFPARLTLPQAKEYIYRELEPLPLAGLRRTPEWCEEPTRVVLVLQPAGDRPRGDDCRAVPLEPGVSELLRAEPGVPVPGHPTGLGWRTTGIAFDRADGWDRGRAEQWLSARAGAADPGRTAKLAVMHRMRPELAARVGGWLGASTAPLPPEPSCRLVLGPAFEFLPVPPLDSPSRPRDHRGGAGIELDLADARLRDRLPNELRASLPPLGLVNYLEARAVVEALEALPPDTWDATAASGSVAVLALYPAQAELIRLLVRSSPALARTGARLIIEPPAAVRRQEFDTVLVSLTRSHSHRAVTFGDGLDGLITALTRARSRLVVVGDHGTLARRCQWDGTVDQYDESTARRERAVIAGLLRCARPSSEQPSRPVPVGQGSST